MSAVPVEFQEIPDGFPGTALIIAKMRECAIAALRDVRIHELARKLTAHLPSRDCRGESEAFLRHLQPGGTGGYRYTYLPWDRKEWGFQRIATASWTLLDAPTRSGECCSLTIAYAALARCLGHEVMYRTAGQYEDSLFDHGHVYALDDLVEGPWTAADPSYPDPLGWPHGARATPSVFAVTRGPVDPGSRVKLWMDWRI